MWVADVLEQDWASRISDAPAELLQFSRSSKFVDRRFRST